MVTHPVYDPVRAGTLNISKAQMMESVKSINDGTIIGIGDELIEDTKEPGVVWLDGAGFGVLDQKVYEELTIPEEVEIDKHKYIDGEFVENENYSEPLNQEKLAQRVKDLENIIDALLGGEDNE